MPRCFLPATNPVSSTDTIWWWTAPLPAAATGPSSSRAMSRCARRSITARGEPSRLDRRENHGQSVARFWDRPDLPVRRVAGLERDAEILQEMPREAFSLHIGEVQTEAHMRAAAERHPGEAMTRALRLVGKAHRIEFFGIGPDIRHVVGEQRIDADHGAGRDRIALEGE